MVMLRTGCFGKAPATSTDRPIIDRRGRSELPTPPEVIPLPDMTIRNTMTYSTTVETSTRYHPCSTGGGGPRPARRGATTTSTSPPAAVPTSGLPAPRMPTRPNMIPPTSRAPTPEADSWSTLGFPAPGATIPTAPPTRPAGSPTPASMPDTAPHPGKPSVSALARPSFPAAAPGPDGVPGGGAGRCPDGCGHVEARWQQRYQHPRCGQVISVNECIVQMPEALGSHWMHADSGEETVGRNGTAQPEGPTTRGAQGSAANPCEGEIWVVLDGAYGNPGVYCSKEALRAHAKPGVVFLPTRALWPMCRPVDTLSQAKALFFEVFPRRIKFECFR